MPPREILVLVPTELEWRRLVDAGGLEAPGAHVELCGFGPLAAAARTAQLLESRSPAGVLLVGIAGAYDVEQRPVGQAFEFSAVAVDGIGAGEGDGLRGPTALGFPQWPGGTGSAGHPICERLPLALPPSATDGGLLLTTCAASDSARQAARRRERFPDVTAEDMEGFAVALACRLASVPLRVVRGISNEVGVRDAGSWRIPAALSAARTLAQELLEAPGPWEPAG